MGTYYGTKRGGLGQGRPDAGVLGAEGERKEMNSGHNTAMCVDPRNGRCNSIRPHYCDGWEIRRPCHRVLRADLRGRISHKHDNRRDSAVQDLQEEKEIVRLSAYCANMRKASFDGIARLQEEPIQKRSVKK